MTALVEPEVSRIVRFVGRDSDLPQTATRRAKSLVRVRDGEKIYLGGLLSEEKRRTMKKVPLLGDIPLLGYLFRHYKDDNSQVDLVIEITPHIVGDEGAMLPVAPQPRTRAEASRSMDISEILLEGVRRRASDILISAGAPITYQVDGLLERHEPPRPLTAAESENLTYQLLKDAQRKEFEQELELDLSFHLKDVSRFRVSVFRQRGTIAAVLRLVPLEIPRYYGDRHPGRPARPAPQHPRAG